MIEPGAHVSVGKVSVLTAIFLLAALSCCANLNHLRTSDPNEGPIDSVERYIIASAREDPVAAVRELQPELIQSRGGSSVVIAQLRRNYAINGMLTMRPRRIELGRPVVFEEVQGRFAWVPIRLVTPGFPNEMISTSYYAVTSTPKDGKWYVLDISCREETWAKSVFRNYPFDEKPSRFTEAIRVLEFGENGKLVDHRRTLN